MRPMMVLLPGGPRGSSGPIVSISNGSVDASATSPSSATAYYELQSDGDTVTSDGAIADWLIGSVTGSDYECRATLVSGTLSTGTTGSWLALSSPRSWTVTRSSLGSKTCTFDVEVGLVGTSTALDTARITLTAEVIV